MKKLVYCSISIVLWINLSGLPLISQQAPSPEYEQFIAKGDCESALKVIKKRLGEIYDLRTENKRIPADFITSKKLAESINLNELFRKRKLEGFFIENNSELHALHRAAGRCLVAREEFDEALNHYYQSMRFSPVEYEKSDVIFYEISQVYKKLKHRTAYMRAIEAAYTLNTQKHEYSRELGVALYATNDKKRAIFHLERFLESAGDRLDEPDLLLMAGNLNEDIGRYLETVRYYREYLKRKPDNGYIQFALGYLAYRHTGDFPLALAGFDRALKLLPESELFRRSKAFEYTGDIYLKEMESEKAIFAYLETIKYQDSIRGRLKKKEQEISAVKQRIAGVKSELIKKEDFNKYNEYEYLMDEKGKYELEKRDTSYSFNKLNAGGVRWNIAECYEKLGKLADAITYYRQCIDYNYNAGGARERIIKLQLKISRGY